MGSSPGKTEDYKIGICCFCPKHTVLGSKNKDRLAVRSVWVE